MKKVAVVMSSVAGLFLLGMVAGYSRADVPEIPGKIVYTQGEDLWVAMANGDNPRQLTTSGDCSNPSWSSDSTKIAYLRDGNIWIINADGSNPQELTTTKDCEEFSLSPNGTKIAYIRSFAAKGNGYSWCSYLWCYDLTTRSAARVVPDSDILCYYPPKWSPDGKWLAFSVDLKLADCGPPTCRLEICSPSGQSRKMIIKEAYDLDFLWSPDGRRLYISSGSDESQESWRVATVELTDLSYIQNIYKVQLGDSCESLLKTCQLINEEELGLFESVDEEIVRIVILNVRSGEFKRELQIGGTGAVCFLGNAKMYWFGRFGGFGEEDWLLSLVVNGKIVKTIEGEDVSWNPESSFALTALVGKR